MAEYDSEDLMPRPMRGLRRWDHPGPEGLPPPEVKVVEAWRVSCDGGEGALGHPRVWYTIPPDEGFIDCGYCDARFVHRSVAEGRGTDRSGGARTNRDGHAQPADQGAPVKGPQPG